MVQQLLERRVPQFLGLYLATGWATLEFSQWIVNRFLLSSGLTDLVFVGWLAMLPTVLIISYFHGKPGPDPWTKGQRMAVSANFVVAMVILGFLGANRELGAMTESVTLVDETGATLEREVPKSQFRRRIGIFFFQNGTGLEENDWTETGLPVLLETDLYQDVFLALRGVRQFAGKLQEAGQEDRADAPLSLKRRLADEEFLDHFVTGVVEESDAGLSVRMEIYETETGQRIAEDRFSLDDPFTAVDAMSVAIKRALDLPLKGRNDLRDLPVAQITTDSVAALRESAKGFKEQFVNKDWAAAAQAYRRAAEIDPTYALAHFQLYGAEILQNRQQEALEALSASMRYVYRLPERLQYVAKSESFLMDGQDMDSAVRVLEMLATVFPEDLDALKLLAALQEATGKEKEAVKTLERLLELDPRLLDTLVRMGRVQQGLGDYEGARERFQAYREARPQDPQGPLLLGDLAQLTGDIEAAEEHFFQASVLDPVGQDAAIKLAQVEFHRGRFAESLRRLETLAEKAETAGQRQDVQRALFYHHLDRGRTKLAIEHFERYEAALRETQPPLLVSISRRIGIPAYVAAGDIATAEQMVEEAGKIPPPLDRVSSILELQIGIELRDPDRLKQSLPGVQEFIAFQGAARLQALGAYGTALNHELAGELSDALSSYEKAFALEPGQTEWQSDVARMLRLLGRFPDAQSRISAGLAARPMSGPLNLEASQILVAMEQTDEAKEYLNTALEIWENADPEFAPALKAKEFAANLVN